MKNKYAILLTVMLGFGAAFMYYLGINKPIEKNEFSEENKSLNWKSGKTDKPDEFTKYFQAITTPFGKEGNSYPMGYKAKELKSAKGRKKNLKENSKFTTVWTERGPANVGGRTRGLIIDPDDATHNTWFAGAATGGIWKTIDGGQTWTCLTDDQPNLSANTLAMAASNHDVIYAGTGESFPGGTYMKGSGVYKTTDRGNTWNQLASTANNEFFGYVNRLVVDPANPDIVVVATEEGIIKTIDGGANWDTVYVSKYGIEDLDADPSNFNNLYATEHSIGVVKSIDAGDNWLLFSNGLEQGLRYELAISPVNTSKIYLSINTSESPVVYRSIDAGATWEKFKKKDYGTHDYLGGQGEYDNIITCHPYNEDIAYLGGVNLFKVDFSDPGTLETLDPEVYRIDQIDIESFMYFQTFSNANYGGILVIGNSDDNQVTSDDFSSVEIRFGTGLSQKAHRFTVGGVGSGVPDNDYIYEDMVDIPFQAWDITNNRQLMVSFRDQEENGVFDLEHFDSNDGSTAREYIFIHSISYNEAGSAEIQKNGGQAYKQIYFVWPRLAEEATSFDPGNLPNSKVVISYGSLSARTGSSYIVTDAYGSGNNNYNQSAGYGTTAIPGIHPDHHNLVFIKTNEAEEEFIAINANDGGLGISTDNAQIFNQLPNNYRTTQFYGVAKKPRANEYFGGMQDNGTWQSKADENANSDSKYLFRLGGDGFECMWHYTNGNNIIGSLYYNRFYRSTDGGKNFYTASSGITSEDGPFISRISSHRNTPDNLYAVGKSGVYKSTNFGTSWTMKAIGTGWLPSTATSVTSQHNVEVSLANENIVWAGAAMASAYGYSIFVSTDMGETYSAVADFTGSDLSGYISGIATHPFEDSTAYLLFSFPGEPKVLRTKNLGQTWEDLSGFVGNTSSSNGFPDVVVHSLLVLPNDPSTIWVGTDIGLFESNDNGATWHYADNGIPAVSVYDMFVQDNQVVVATHGRGIWSAAIDEMNFIPEATPMYMGQQTIEVAYTLQSNVDSVEVYLNNQFVKVITNNITTGNHTEEVSVSNEGVYKVYLISYQSNNSYRSLSSNVMVDFKPVITQAIKDPDADNIIKITADINELYDSLQILLNNEVNNTVTGITPGSNILTTSITATQKYSVTIKGYIDNIGYLSNSKDVTMTYVGIGDLSEIKQLKVYPNPTSGFINVEIPKEINDNVTVDIYSLNGVKLNSHQVNKDNGRLDISGLNNGIYLLRMEYNGKIYSQKVKLTK